MITIPLFPLPLVLFPGGKLPLQIFETRYVDMIKDSLAKDTGFGIVLIEQGEQIMHKEHTEAPTVSQIGTFAKVVDFDQLSNGLLGVTVEGKQKFLVINTREQEDRLLLADVEYLQKEEEQPFPNDKTYLIDLLRALAEHDAVRKLDLGIAFHDVREVGCRLAELIPFPNSEKQKLLELDDPLIRLDELASIISELQITESEE
jgi:Lon protease-like protein